MEEPFTPSFILVHFRSSAPGQVVFNSARNANTTQEMQASSKRQDLVSPVGNPSTTADPGVPQCQHGFLVVIVITAFTMTPGLVRLPFFTSEYTEKMKGGR